MVGENRQLYTITYQEAVMVDGELEVQSSKPIFYREEPMLREDFVNLTNQLFQEYGNNLGAVTVDLQANHGFVFAPDISAIVIIEEGMMHIR